MNRWRARLKSFWGETRSIPTGPPRARKESDDYICKPFNATELIARIEAITRRSRELPNAVLTIGALRIDLRRKVVRVGQRDINLTPREFDVVEALAKRPGAIISKENLMLILYQGMSNVHMKIIDVYICKIRKKIE